MTSDQSAGQDHEPATAAVTQAARLRAAIAQVVAVGPDFLRGEFDAARMAQLMVRAARDCAAAEQAAGGNGATDDAEARELQAVLAELMGCGSGYLAGRCDGACVARTMTQMVHAFRPH